MRCPACVVPSRSLTSMFNQPCLSRHLAWVDSACKVVLVLLVLRGAVLYWVWPVSELQFIELSHSLLGKLGAGSEALLLQIYGERGKSAAYNFLTSLPVALTCGVVIAALDVHARVEFFRRAGRGRLILGATMVMLPLGAIALFILRSVALGFWKMTLLSIAGPLWAVVIPAGAGMLFVLAVSGLLYALKRK